MIKKGDIYNYYNEAKKKYTALQVAEENQYILLALYYWEDEALTADKLNEIKPFWKDHHSWKGEYTFIQCEGSMPDNYTFVGNREVMVTPEEPETSSWYYNCLQISLQKAWDELPESFRTGYKNNKYGSSIMLAKEIAALTDGSGLGKYNHLTQLEVEGANNWVMDYINEHHNITELSWKNASEKVIDLSKNRITDFKTDGKGICKIILSDYLNAVYFLDTVPETLQLIPTAKNGALDLHLRNTINLQVFKNINITELYIVGNGKEPIDMKQIADNFNNLQVLRIWGAPDFIYNFNEIASLKHLRWLTLKEIFGFTVNDIPLPQALPAIKRIWMDSIPDEAAQKVKKEYKFLAKNNKYDLWITKGRKPDWLEANLNNPFRHWDGDEFISPAHAKKAAKIYTNYYNQINKLITENTSADQLQNWLEEMVKTYTQEFNKMDKRTHWIDTVTREDIWEALNLLLKPVTEVYGTKVDTNELFELFEKIMDF